MATNGKQKKVDNNAEELDVKQRTNATVITNVLFTGEEGKTIEGHIISSILLRDEQLEEFERRQRDIAKLDNFIVVKKKMEVLYKEFMKMN